MNAITRPRMPIACSLTAAELTDRQTAWRKLLDGSLLTRDRIAGGLRLSFHPGSALALRDLVELERECCPWILFEVEGAVVTMSAVGVGERNLDTMFA